MPKRAGFGDDGKPVQPCSHLSALLYEELTTFKLRRDLVGTELPELLLGKDQRRINLERVFR